jgi:DNA polymerase III delta prime subunit
MVNQLLTEKLRPRELKHMILPDRIRNLFDGKPLAQNVLLAGSPGCGKTTLAKILAANSPHLFINVSDESSVDVIRTKINDFCSTLSIMDGKSALKVVILDEFDGASDQFYKALRGTIEKFAKNARFVATCNWIAKVPEAIQSRFEVINFDPVNSEEEQGLKEEWRKRITLILNKLSISIDEEALNVFERDFFPDLRSALNKIQAWSIEGLKRIDAKKVKDSSYSHEELYRLICEGKNPIENYQFVVSQYSGKVDSVMLALGNEFVGWIQHNRPDLSRIIPSVIVMIAEHQAQRMLVIDPIVSLLALVYKIQKQIQA